MLIDSHAHIHFKEFQGEIPQLLERARMAGVDRLINVGTDLESSRQVIQLTREYPQIYAAVGVHPHEVARMGKGNLVEIEGMAGEERVVAIGEVGLDYYYEHSPKEIQQERLREFIRLAHRVGRPLILHCRDAFEDAFRILDEEDGWRGGGVFHCYTGDWPTSKKILEKGFYLSFSGIVTFKKTQALQEAARRIPEDRFLIETDCPFLAPEPHRGKRNEPAYVRRIAEKLAEIRGVTLERIAEVSSRNAETLFDLSA